VPLLGADGSPCNTMWPGPRPTLVPSGILIHPTVWPLQTWAENWGLCPLFLAGAAGSPSITMWPRLKPTSILRDILIHPAVWPQYTNVKDRQTGQDRTRQTTDRWYRVNHGQNALLIFHEFLGDYLQNCSAVAEMGDRLAIIDMGKKLGAVPILGELDPHVTQSGLGQSLPLYRVAA